MSNYRLRFLRLTGHNVCSYPDFDIDLTNQGSVLLSGRNGSGKSTPWYALTHLLYSMTSKGVRYKDLINIHDPRDYHMRLDLEIDGVPYAIEEYREHRLHGSCRIIWRNGQDVTPQGERAVKAYIPRLLNLDQQSFLSNVFLSQEHTHLLVEGRPADRQKHIMWLFGLHAFDNLASEAKKERDALKNQIADVERIQEEIQDIDDQLKELPTRSFTQRVLSEAKTEQKGLEKEITVLEGRRARLAERVTKVEIRDNLVDELRGLGLDESPTATDVAELAQHVTELVDTLAQAKSDLVLVRKAEQLRAELENYRELPPVSELTKQLEKVQEKKLLATEVTLPRAKRAANLRKKINKITRDETDNLDEFEAKEIEFKTHIKKLTRRIKELEHQIKKGVCPTCKRPWELSLEELQGLKTTLTDTRGRLDDANKRYYVLHGRAEDARQWKQLNQKLKGLPEMDPQDVEIEIATLVRQETGLRADVTVANQRQEIRAKLEEVPNGTVESFRERVTRITGQLMKTRTLHTRTKQAHELLRRIADLPTGDLPDLRSDLDEVDQALKDASTRAKDVQVTLTESTADLREINRLIEQRRAKEQRVQSASAAIRDSRIWEALRQGFGFLLRQREHKLLQRITKELPTYFNPLFGDMSQWCNVELCKETGGGIDIQVVARNRLLPTKAPSPGMKAKLGISLLFALRDLYAQNQCNLMVLDEPLWKIDQEARPAFLEILDQLKQKVETLIITTHEQEIKGHAFDHRWEARIENGLSVLHI